MRDGFADNERRPAVIWSPNLGVFAVSAAGVLCAFPAWWTHYLDSVSAVRLAVWLRGASVIGRLNLGGRTVRCPLELYGCYLGDRLDLAKAEASDISLRGSHLAQRLSARRLRMPSTHCRSAGQTQDERLKVSALRRSRFDESPRRGGKQQGPSWSFAQIRGRRSLSP